ncbi:6-phospho-3-hexuloisomerase [Granulicella cerasi]|uniref:6-phospho-3-hexuloisomerase n=1 Tax=Granulicella cerasi TaxID=741063 RepID=A0ABW1ZCM4_9BACT|nr:6-phospho-3-hexuloisomerase [Granulicella cerasi]
MLAGVMPFAEAILDSRTLILEELQRSVSSVDSAALHEAKKAVLAAESIFTAGAGRSRLSLMMAAMRLMHLGLRVHVAGETTTPAIKADDLLIIASGSGTTVSALAAASVAKKVGAKVLAITTAAASPLGVIADHLLVVQAAGKQEHGGTISRQYAGSLFEQSVLLLVDSLFDTMWRERGESAEELWKRHANLE